MRAQIEHPVQLSAREQRKLVSDFVKAMGRARGDGDASRRVIAYLKFHPWRQELAQAVKEMRGWRLNKAFRTWFAIGIEVENMMK